MMSFRSSLTLNPCIARRTRAACPAECNSNRSWPRIAFLTKSLADLTGAAPWRIWKRTWSRRATISSTRKVSSNSVRKYSNLIRAKPLHQISRSSQPSRWGIARGPRTCAALPISRTLRWSLRACKAIDARTQSIWTWIWTSSASSPSSNLDRHATHY